MPPEPFFFFFSGAEDCFIYQRSLEGGVSVFTASRASRQDRTWDRTWDRTPVFVRPLPRARPCPPWPSSRFRRLGRDSSPLTEPFLSVRLSGMKHIHTVCNHPCHASPELVHLPKLKRCPHETLAPLPLCPQPADAFGLYVGMSEGGFCDHHRGTWPGWQLGPKGGGLLLPPLWARDPPGPVCLPYPGWSSEVPPSPRSMEADQTRGRGMRGPDPSSHAPPSTT